MWLVFELVDFLLYVLVIFLRFFVLRLAFERLLVMLERVCPIAQFLLVALFLLTALIKRVAEIVVTLRLQIGIASELRLTK